MTITSLRDPRNEIAADDPVRQNANPVFVERIKATLRARLSPRNYLLLIRTVRLLIIASLDAVAVLVALFLAAMQNGSALAEILARSGAVAVLFATICTAIFMMTGIYKRSWRFMSFGDGLYIGLAVTAALSTAWTACLLVFPELRLRLDVVIPFAIVHAALVLVAMASMRILRRAYRENVRRSAAIDIRRRSALLLGSSDWARAMIELVQSDTKSGVRVDGILTPDGMDRRLRFGGVPVLGSPEALEDIVNRLDQRGTKPDCIILQDDDSQLSDGEFMRLASLVNDLGMILARTHDPWNQMTQQRPKLNLQYLPLADLLGRPEIKLERGMVDRVITGRVVLVTGAGGTIGSELVRQLAAYGAEEIVLLDHAEYSLYAIDMEMRERHPDITFHTALASVRQRDALFEVFERHEPDIVFHAAALKHVPLVEANPCAGVHTNVIGTKNVADAVCEFGVRAMVQVSTDKAVNPVGLMGATKRVGELYCQALDLVGESDVKSPRFMTVRFGNVLGSSGSLIPLFQNQLANGKPLTVTHPDIERFFMTVQEAVQLILTSSSRALEKRSGRGSIFVLDMGEPIKIVDLAKRMIRSVGLQPGVDVKIEFIGLRPGEKLYEELFDASEQRFESALPRIFEARPCPVSLPLLVKRINELERLIQCGDAPQVMEKVHSLVKLSSSQRPGTRPDGIRNPGLKAVETIADPETGDGGRPGFPRKGQGPALVVKADN